MREILFRGKRVDNGEWVYGFLRCMNYIDVWEQKVYYDGQEEIKYCTTNSYQVKPETVGEFTGLLDKNGNKIFEGDVVKITDKIVGYERFAFIEFGNPNAQYDWGWQLHPISKEPFAVAILHWVDMEESGAFIEVIGNICDNKELLK